MIRLNNGDFSKILATIIAAIYDFTDEYPEKIILFTGSTESRTRLYRIIISLNIEKFNEDFSIYGELDRSSNYWEKFKKGKPYIGFAVKRKINNLQYEKKEKISDI